jgi:hypothetical protein
MQVNINTAEAIEESKKLIKGIKIPEIKNKEDNIIATNSVNLVKSHIKIITERRLKITRLIDASKKEVMGLFAPYLEKLEEYKNQLDINMKAWNEKEEKRLRELQLKIDEENRKKQVEIDKRIAKAKKLETKERLADKKEIIANTQTIIVPEKTEGGYWTKNQKWRYQKGYGSNNIELKKILLDKYPHLIKIDEVALGKFAVQVKRMVEIEGIYFYEDKTWVSK